MITLKPQKLKSIIQAILQKAGSEPLEAEIVSDHLLEANLVGHDSHGVGMIPTYIRNLKAGLLKANQHARLVKDEGSIMMFDGQQGYGQVQAKEAMAAAIQRCQAMGLVLMTLRNSHHIGRIGSYGEQGIEAGLVSLHFVNVRGHKPIVAPFGGKESRFITNPICIAMPSPSGPILLDMATSKIAMGKARVAMLKGEQVLEGALIDAEGLPTTEPQVLFKEPLGALLPFGEHKGYGLALFCELLAGGLSGGGTIQPENERSSGVYNNMFSLIIDPKKLVDETWLSHEVMGPHQLCQAARRKN
ncbi:MAG: malate/lactate/ureidoglycolate dehydrogenase [Deinococcales bacterium]